MGDNLMENENTILWWGYIHENNNVQAKRYFQPLDIREAQESPFCKWVTLEPFEANDRDDALDIIKQEYEEYQNKI